MLAGVGTESRTISALAKGKLLALVIWPARLRGEEIAARVGLKLVPRREEPEYEYFVVAVDPATLQWRALMTHDRQGGESTLVFSDLKENQGLRGPFRVDTCWTLVDTCSAP